MRANYRSEQQGYPRQVVPQQLLLQTENFILNYFIHLAVKFFILLHHHLKGKGS